jgi:PleD family two-component response regulator
VAVGERRQARDTITRADEALYRAKADGRDRVVLDTSVPATT